MGKYLPENDHKLKEKIELKIKDYVPRYPGDLDLEKARRIVLQEISVELSLQEDPDIEYWSDTPLRPRWRRSRTILNNLDLCSVERQVKQIKPEFTGYGYYNGP